MNIRFLVFSVLACAFSWLCWFSIIGELKTSPFESSGSVLLLFFLGAYAPTLIGILLTYIYGRKTALKDLFRSALNIKIGVKYFFLAFIAGPIVYGISVFLYSLFGGDLGTINYGLLPWIPIVFIVPVIFGPLAEEFGWRGFALPLLKPNDRFFFASVCVGFVWALWHAPLFWAATGTAISGFPVTLSSVGLFFLAVMGSSFIYTWFFNETSGSLFSAIFLHLSMNATGIIVGMLFPDLSSEQKLWMYKLYTLGLWGVLLVIWGATLIKKNSRPEI